jgi:hypothetical protein
MRTSRKLHARLAKMILPLDLPTGPQGGRADVPDLEELIKDGFDPVHAIYTFVQNITSVFAEGISPLPEMKKYARLAGKAEDQYMPSGPPLSPLTRSFFTTWAFYDLRFDGADTVGTCLIEANDLVRMNPDQLDALRKLADSRMGIYEHLGVEDGHVRLRELITAAEFTCHIASGYRGAPGELWYVRCLPPLLPDLASYHIAFTTPYVLTNASKADWMQFLRRGISRSGLGNDQQRLHQFLKYGSDPNYWNEFVLKAYHHHHDGVILLAGIPDLNATLPHA